MGRKIEHLLQPIMVNHLGLRNRIVMAPMNGNFAGPNGEVTSQMIDYYEKRAKGGVGLIIVEATAVVSDVKNLVCQPRISDDSYIPGYGNLVERIHAWGAKTSLQIQHSGNEASYGRLVSSSNVTSRPIGGIPIPLAIGEIGDLIGCFIEAARRAKLAGFDGVELHGAHGYLVNQFMSPLYNRRTDIYGGSVENRARFAVQIIEGIKELLGDDFTVSVRFSADEYVDGGLTIDESKEFATLFQAAGANYLHISSGIYDSLIYIAGPASMPKGMFLDKAKVIRKVVDIPVVAVGRINDPLFAEQILLDGSADMVAFGRAFLADPKFPRKIYEGRLDEIRKCIGCKYCMARISSGLDVRCAVNPTTGRERYFEESGMTEKPKKVFIIGGGPAGMQAAISAKKLGHRVTLMEESEELGGQLVLAVIPPFKETHYLLEYLRNKVQKLAINVGLGQEVSVVTVEQATPDVIILAAGAQEKEPDDIKIEGENVISAWEALLNPKRIGRRVAIVGGGSVGCETAEFLAGTKVELQYLGMKGQGPELKYAVNEVNPSVDQRDVTVLEMLEEVASDEEVDNRTLLLLRLKENGVTFLTKAKVQEITGNVLTYFDLNDLEVRTIEADTFVLATGVKPNNEFLGQLLGKGFRVMAVGDCVQPGKIQDAIYQGALAARQI